MKDDFKPRPRRAFIDPVQRVRPQPKPEQLDDSLTPRELPLPQRTPAVAPKQENKPAAVEPQVKDEPTPNDTKTSFKDKLFKRVDFLPKNFSKKQWALFIAALIAVLGITGAGAFALYKKVSFAPPPPETYFAPHEKKEEPTTVASPLTGLQVDPEIAKRPIIGVMIENSPDARPQAGLKDAGVVFEAVAEGGITRFLALFQDTEPDYIGPIRSARPYYLDWTLAFDAAYAHVGGSPEALSEIGSLGVRDLDQFHHSGAYHRVSSRFAPHNMYSGIPALRDVALSKGYTGSNFTPWERKEEKASETPNAKNIGLDISSANYNVRFEYNAESNSYKRIMAGRPHTDERSGDQISPKVVIALVSTKGLAADRLHTTYETTGSNTVFIFQDGVMKEGKWHKPNRKSQFTFKDLDGNVIKLNPGQAWVTVIDAASKVTYQ